MEDSIQELFLNNWSRYFGKAELPITFFYTDQASEEDLAETQNVSRCLICNLKRVREGHAFVYTADSPGCSGGKRYTGYSQELRSNFEYFLSCGIPGEMEGERYKKSPELVREFIQNIPPFQAPARRLVFKRWDKLREAENPSVAIFFAEPDVLSGLFTLANYDWEQAQGVIAPMGSGCSSIVAYPLEEAKSDRPRGVLGMFDVSARPCVPENTLTFAVPFERLVEMVANMEESFLITNSWKSVKQRIDKR
jgi:uncharacterized protein (DUF169 family)